MELRLAYQVTTFVVEEAIESLVDSVCSKFPLKYGKYNGLCWWSAPGIEQFTPLEGSSPVQGTIGTRERVSAIAVHFIIPRDESQLEVLIDQTIVPAHPWDEPVIIVNEVQITADVSS